MAGLTPVDDDEKVAGLLEAMIGRDTEKLTSHMQDLRETVVQTESDGQPEVFSYAKMMNFFRSGQVDRNDLVHLLAAAMWQLHGQSNAKIYALRGDTEVHMTETDEDGRTQV